MATTKKERKFKPAQLSSRNYKGAIEFPEEGLNLSFDEFKELYGENHVFADMQPGVRETELKAAHKIATDGNIKAATNESPKAK